MRARNRELLGLIPASLLISAGFAAVFIQRSNQLSSVSLIYGAVFLGLCLAGHIFIRVTLPHADPYIFPLVAVLACFGLVMVYRISGETSARRSGAVVRARAGAVRRHGDLLPGLPQARELPLPDRDRLAGPADPAARPGAGGSGQRRLPGDPPARDHLPADRVRQDRPGHLPRELPARPPPGARLRPQDPRLPDAAAQAPRAAAAALGRGDGAC